MRPTSASALYQPLDHILGSPALVRVVRVLAGHGGSLGVSDIARRARISLPSTRAALRRLVEAELVSAVGAGRSVVCALRSAHPLVPALVALFASEREQADAVLSAIRRAAAALEPAPLAVWLYGSVARGEDVPTSDIDIALVSAEEDPTTQLYALREAVVAAIPESEHRISLIGFGPRDVRRHVKEGAEVWQAMTRDAVVLAGDDPVAVVERTARSGRGM